VLPTEVRVTATTHPLVGRLLLAGTFRRRNGVLLLVVTLPDGTPGTIRADATSVFGEAVAEGGVTVLSAEGLRGLRVVIQAQQRQWRGGRRRRRRGLPEGDEQSTFGAQTRK
jgi:hypothetical protein